MLTWCRVRYIRMIVDGREGQLGSVGRPTEFGWRGGIVLVIVAGRSMVLILLFHKIGARHGE